MIGPNGRQVRTSGAKRQRVFLGQGLTDLELRVSQRLTQLDEPTVRLAAQDLGMSENAVKLHVTRIYRKLGVTTRLGLYRAITEDNVRDRCRHCKQPIKRSDRWAPSGREYVHVTTGTWWCAPTTTAEPEPEDS